MVYCAMNNCTSSTHTLILTNLCSLGTVCKFNQVKQIYEAKICLKSVLTSSVQDYLEINNFPADCSRIH